MSTPEDPFAGSDVTILRPRPGRRGSGPRDALPGTPSSPSSQQQSADLLQSSSSRSSSGIGDAPASGQNPLLQAAVPLLVLAGRLRGQAAHTDIGNLRAQTVNEMRAFEDRVRAAGVPSEDAMAARYALCTVLDEAVLNTPWGAQS